MPDEIDLLLVEDDPQFVRMFKALAATIGGVKVTHVDRLQSINGELNHCDVMFLDLILPDSTGAETLDSVGKYADKLPVVVVSSMDDDATIANVGASEAVGYMAKSTICGPALRHLLRFAAEKGRTHAIETFREGTRAHNMIERLKGIGRRGNEWAPT